MSPLRYLLAGCPSCRGNQTREARLEAVLIDPGAHQMNPEIAEQWHSAKNGKVRLEAVSPGSRRQFWWRDADCGHEWQDSPAGRDSGQRLRCPFCRTILDSLAFHYPQIAAEWSDRNPLTAWQVRPTGQTAFLPEWICRTNPNHVWQAVLSSRSSGSGCPECREHGKSTVELDHYAATVRIFGKASSGRPVSVGTAGRRTWFVDIAVDLDDGSMLVIEYDGSYWHTDKADIDTRKTLDLLAAGHAVARLREHPLPPLAVTTATYREFVVYSQAPDPEAVIGQVKRWAKNIPHARPRPAE